MAMMGDKGMSKMIEQNKENSKRKIAEAERVIELMVERQEKVTVTTLVKVTGFSKSFFYRNPELRKKIEDVAKYQVAACNTREQIDMITLQEENRDLKMTIKLLNLQIERLERKNKELEKKLELLI